MFDAHFRCEICGMSFKSASPLVTHMMKCKGPAPESSTNKGPAPESSAGHSPVPERSEALVNSFDFPKVMSVLPKMQGEKQGIVAAHEKGRIDQR